MIKALLLIFEPAVAWDRIVAKQRAWVFILLVHVLPLVLIVSAVEGYGLIRWGKPRGEIMQVATLSLAEALVYEVFQIIMALVAIIAGARLIKSLGETFHGRHSFTQAFTVSAYGLSPVFLMRIFDIFPNLSPWVTWAIGIILSAGILYHGIPRVMLPDPPHAFGLYLTSTLLLGLVTGLTRFFTAFYLMGKFPKLDAIVARLIEHLPFLK
ncbi:MAG: hypothetical protein QOD03_960 [Verrucomicrobiota bacterium]|jgi:hypothetical protein